MTPFFLTGLKSYNTLHVAARKNDIVAIEELLSRGQSVDTRESIHHATALHYAAERGHIEAARLLLDKGANFQAKTKGNALTPLHLAAQHQRKNVCRLLLKKGANTNAREREGLTPLQNVCQTAFSSDILNLMISKGGNVREFDNARRGCLHIIGEKSTAKLDQEKICQILINTGCEVNAKDQSGWTPLHYAAYHGQYEVCGVLISNKAGIMALTDKKSSPLHFAAENGHYNIVELLLNNGADVNAQDCDKWTPLHFAADRDNSKIVELLCIQLKADPNLSDEHGYTALHLAARQGNLSAALKLISAARDRVDINAKAFNNQATPLHLASRVGDFDLVKSLLESGGYYNIALGSSIMLPIIECFNKVELLFKAVSHNNIKLIKSLIDSGVVTNARDCRNNRSALHYAIDNGNAELIEYLLDKGARLDFASLLGYTVLHLAVLAKKSNMVSVLIKHAMNNLDPVDLIGFIDSKSIKERESALHMATKLDQKDNVKLLIASGAIYNESNKNGWTPAQLVLGEFTNYFRIIDEFFSFAISGDNQQVVETLNKEPTVINARHYRTGGTALHGAIEKGHNNVARTLIKRGANVCLVTNRGNTVLHIASFKGNADIIDELIERCPDSKKKQFVNFRTFINKNSPLHFAKTDYVALRLMQNGADYNIKNNKGESTYDVARDKNVKRLLNIVCTARCRVCASGLV